MSSSTCRVEAAHAAAHPRAADPGRASDADAAFSDASLAEVTRDALTRDYRLLTRDPDDPAVQLEASGKALRQGRYPGCAGELAVEPDVPEGHREIRIEYRTPASPHARGSHD